MSRKNEKRASDSNHSRLQSNAKVATFSLEATHLNLSLLEAIDFHVHHIEEHLVVAVVVDRILQRFEVAVLHNKMNFDLDHNSAVLLLDRNCFVDCNRFLVVDIHLSNSVVDLGKKKMELDLELDIQNLDLVEVGSKRIGLVLLLRNWLNGLVAGMTCCKFE